MEVFRENGRLTLLLSILVACAELINNFLPKIVDLHNYSPANSISQKIYNWHTLNSNWIPRLVAHFYFARQSI